VYRVVRVDRECTFVGQIQNGKSDVSDEVG
jgi:hypothetical protein